MSGQIRQALPDVSRNRLVTLNQNNTINIWRLESLAFIRQIKQEGNIIALHGDKLLVADYDAVVSLWDLNTGKKLTQRGLQQSPEDYELRINNMAVSAVNGNIFIDSSWFSVIFDASLSQEIYRTEKPLDGFVHLPKNDLVVQQEHDEATELLVFDLGKAKIVNRLALAASHFVANEAEDTLLCSVGEGIRETPEDEHSPFVATQLQLVEWNLHSNEVHHSELLKLKRWSGVEQLSYSGKDGAISAVISEAHSTRTLYMFDSLVSPARAVHTFPEAHQLVDMVYNAEADALIFYVNQELLSNCNSLQRPALYRFDLQAQQLLPLDYLDNPPHPGDAASINYLSVPLRSAESRLLVLHNCTAELWDTKTWRMRYRVSANASAEQLDIEHIFQHVTPDYHYGSWICDVKFSPNGKTFAVSGDSMGLASAALYNVSGKALRPLQTYIDGRAERVFFSHDSKQILVDYKSDGFALVCTETGQFIRHLTHHSIAGHDFSQSHQTAVFSKNNQRLLAGFDEGSVWLWQLDRGVLEHGLCAVALTGDEDDREIEWQVFDQTPASHNIRMRDDDLIEIKTLAWTTDESAVLIGTETGLYCWDLAAQSVRRICDGEIYLIAVMPGLGGQKDQDHNEQDRLSSIQYAVYDNDADDVLLLDGSFTHKRSVEDVRFWETDCNVFQFAQNGSFIQCNEYRYRLDGSEIGEAESDSDHSGSSHWWDGVSDKCLAISYSSTKEKITLFDYQFSLPGEQSPELLAPNESPSSRNEQSLAENEQHPAFSLKKMLQSIKKKKK